MKKTLFALPIMAALFVGCTGSESEETPAEASAEEKTEEAPACTYEYSDDNTVVMWTAFKTTGRKGVGGKFMEFNVSGTESSETMLDVVKNASIIIPIASTNTNDPERDQRIIEYFFGKFEMPADTLWGKVKSISASEATLELTMNGLAKDVVAKVEVDGERLKLNAVVDLGEFNGESAINGLNEVCGDLHAGDDGITKLWPDVEVQIITELEKVCPE